jgi:hypothetical protein
MFMSTRNSDLTKSSAGTRSEPPLQLSNLGPYNYCRIYSQITSCVSRIVPSVKQKTPVRLNPQHILYFVCLGPPATQQFGGPYNFYRRYSDVPELGSSILTFCQMSRFQSGRTHNIFYVLCVCGPPPPRQGMCGGPMCANVFKLLPSHKERQMTVMRRQELTNDFVKNKPRLIFFISKYNL